MRILIDMQGAQSESRFRGIGRYSLALALGIARNAADHEVWLMLNGALHASIPDLRRAFHGLVPAERIRVFDIPAPTAEISAANVPRCRAAEMLREHFIEQLAPDVVLVTSLFEGYIDDSVVSAGRFACAARTAVVLYDLIPFLNPAAYLGTPEQRQHYGGKIDSLRAAGLLLAISDYTRQEAIEALGLPPEGVVAISTAVDASFHPAPPSAALPALQARCGITRQTIMYAPGGFDARKNIDGLIAAYGLLPRALRARHQLVIASKLGEHERRVMNEHARDHGLAAGELVLTGYVSDTELVDLYRSAALFVFPSKHEGFGLPALEAMACGAIVIGADNTSIPEVIGCEEALFDAATPAAIAAKITQVLTDPALQERLRVHGRAQAARFSWDVTARKTIQALTEHHARLAAAPAAAADGGGSGLAYVWARSAMDAGEDVAVLLPALRKAFDIDVVAAAPLPAALAGLDPRPLAWLQQRAAGYDHIVYDLGNATPDAGLLAMMRSHPGLLVVRTAPAGTPPVTPVKHDAAWADALYHAHGYAALIAAVARPATETDRPAFALGPDVLETAPGAIVDSEDALRRAQDQYGHAATANWAVVADAASPDERARHYTALLALAARHARRDQAALLRAILAISGLPRDQSFLHELAHCLASMPDPSRPRQLLFDMSGLTGDGMGAGKAGTLHSQLLTLLAAPVPGLRVEPVFLSDLGGQWHYRYARSETRALLGVPGSARDAAVDIGPGDLLYSGGPASAAATGIHEHMRARGVKLAWLVGSDDRLDGCAHADAVLCMSLGVMQAVEAWLRAHPALPDPALAVLDPDAGPEQVLDLLARTAQ